MFNLLKKATYYNLKIKNYTQEYFEELSGKIVLAFIKDKGWVYGRFNYTIDIETYQYDPISYDSMQYSRRIDRYSITDTTGVVYSKIISSLIWSTKAPRDIKRPFGLEPKFIDGLQLEPNNKFYFAEMPEIQYIVPEQDISIYNYLKTENIKPT